MLSSLFAIAKNSFAELIRQPIYGILVGVGVLLIATSPIVAMFTLMNGEKMVVDVGLATILLMGLVLAVLNASQLISREIDVRTAGTVISKPVGRFVFVLGKFLGVTAGMVVAAYVFISTLIITLRIGVPEAAYSKIDHPALLALLGVLFLACLIGTHCNYFYRWSFGSTAILSAIPLYALALGLLFIINSNWQFDWMPVAFLTNNTYEVFLAAVLVFLGTWLISSIAVAASTRLNVVPNITVCGAIFFLGMISRYLFGPQVYGQYSAWISVPAAVFYHAVPNMQFFWVANQLMQPEPYVPLSYVGMVFAYTVAYVAGMVALSAFLFERRELI